MDRGRLSRKTLYCTIHFYVVAAAIKILPPVFRILDDMEMYEQQNPFKLTDFILLSNFLNIFLYKVVLGNLFGEY